MLKSPWSRLAVAVTGPNHHATHAFYGAGLRGRNARQALQGTESRRQIASSGNELLDFAMNKREITYQNMGDINGVVGLRNYRPRQELWRKCATSCDGSVLYCPDEYKLVACRFGCAKFNQYEEGCREESRPQTLARYKK